MPARRCLADNRSGVSNTDAIVSSRVRSYGVAIPNGIPACRQAGLRRENGLAMTKNVIARSIPMRRGDPEMNCLIYLTPCLANEAEVAEVAVATGGRRKIRCADFFCYVFNIGFCSFNILFCAH